MSIQRDTSTTAAETPEVPRLSTLGPEYEPELHGRHVAVLVAALTDKTRNARNVALSGHYGSGKSSVVLGVQAELSERGVTWVNLSLSSLGLDNTERARIQEDGGSLPPLTNLIQKEIVKQLLYRKAPSDMPGSRYFRIEPFRAGPAALWSVVAAIAFFVVGVLFGLVGRVEKVTPESIVDHRSAISWTVVATVAVFFGLVWFLGLRSLQNRLRLESLSAGGGGASVSLSAAENSYFDEYLDEIVYFFQQTQTRVAIFEDLDRFKDPHIFETLRELNTVLNNSEQIKSRPIRFVYAVRDSIFEQLKDDPQTPEGQSLTDASALEAAPSANRTKFFDLVVPMVPFITLRSARDLLAAEFEDSDDKPTDELISLVGVHLTDMRLIRNIRNEFEIYRADVLGEGGLDGLTADRLFAMMVYKNLHLDDFEAIRLGTSRIDNAHRAFRSMVEHQIAYQSRLSKAANDRLGKTHHWESHAKAAGDRLRAVLDVMTRSFGQPPERTTVVHESAAYDRDSLGSADLWKSLVESGGEITVRFPGRNVNMSFNEVVEIVGEQASSMSAAVSADKARLQRNSRVALQTKEFVGRATMAELMARTDLTMPSEDGENEHTLKQLVGQHVTGLAEELLARGYIDENYTLYCSGYHAVAISVSAMNFILHSVQRNQPDFQFRFDKPASVAEVEREMGARFLDGESIFNIEVFDYYLAEDPESLANAFAKIVVRSDHAFLNAYLTDGTCSAELVRQLATRWEGLFVYLVEDAPTDHDELAALVDAAIESFSEDIDYATSEHVTEFFANHHKDLRTLTDDEVDRSVGDAVAKLLVHLDARIDDLSVLGNAQRSAVVENGLYPITRSNLITALEAEEIPGLDDMKVDNEKIYERVVAGLREYVELLEPEEVTVTTPDHFTAILNDIQRHDGALIQQVAARASEHCVITDLSAIGVEAWPAVAASRRLSITSSNVSEFLREIGPSEELLENLAGGSIAAGELDDDENADLATGILDMVGLEPGTRVSLVGQLGLTTNLDPAQLPDAALALTPKLLSAGLVADSAVTYSHVSNREFAEREQYFAASKALPSYVTELDLSTKDVEEIFRSRLVGVDVKKAVVDDFDFVSTRLNRATAISIGAWAIKGYEVSTDLLLALSEAKAPADYILQLLEPHLSHADLDVIDRILKPLGNGYDQLTQPGTHRPRVSDRDGTEELLEELKRRGKVSSFKRRALGGFKVHMKRS